jgi:salicylate hydroxylase
MATEDTRADILIAGGGVGGLAAAISIARRGYRVTVLERRPEFTELGAGIQLAPNAFHALDFLGVGDPVRARAVYIDELRFMDGTTGERVAGMPLTGAYHRRFGNPYAVVHRADLYQPLLDACREMAGIDLRGGNAVVRYEQDSSGVTATTETGRRFTGALLIGADGIRSAVRGQLVGDGEPRVSGHTIYRSVIPMDRVPPSLRWNTVTLWAGPEWHFVHYPIGGGRFLNLAATRDDGAQQVVAGPPVERPHVLGEFPGLSTTARHLLELGQEWREWVLCDRDPVREWTDRRVTLLGDAAHPMLQYAAQGACMALEDAVLIGDLLDGAHGAADRELTERLEKYNAERYERVARAQLVARALGTELYHPAGSAATARNAMLASFSTDELYDKVAWLHGARDFHRTEQPVDLS